MANLGNKVGQSKKNTCKEGSNKLGKVGRGLGKGKKEKNLKINNLQIFTISGFSKAQKIKYLSENEFLLKPKIKPPPSNSTSKSTFALSENHKTFDSFCRIRH